MRVVFFGTPEFASPTYFKIVESTRHEVVGVVTQPDKPAGRGHKITAPAIKKHAERFPAPIFQPSTLKKGAFTETLRSLNADVGVVVAYGQILPPDLLTVLPHGFLNVHASLLPKYRGAAPIQWALANGEEKTGVTIMRIEEGLDSGPIIDMHEQPIYEDDDARSLHDMLSVFGGELMLEVLDRLQRDGSLEETPQDHSRATHAPMINREDARIDWEWNAEKIIWRVRAFTGWPGAWSTLNGETFKIIGMEAVDPGWVSVDWRNEDIPLGTVVDVIRGRGFVIKTGKDGLVLATRLQPSGRRDMSAADALNGGYVDVGTRLGT
jgi:methionyl-tRNA formyltransferase